MLATLKTPDVNEQNHWRRNLKQTPITIMAT